jgi:hypothetical protein
MYSTTRIATPGSEFIKKVKPSKVLPNGVEPIHYIHYCGGSVSGRLEGVGPR